MSDINFRDWSYLREGTTVQQRIYQVLTQYHIMQSLEEFDPVLVGTFPIDIAIESSDLDIACCYSNQEDFIHVVTEAFGPLNDLVITKIDIANHPTVVVNFTVEEFPVELFGQSIAVNYQNGYQHMLIEYNILKAKGEEFKQEVIKLKKTGIKTEPAFAQLLGLNGNPYDSLLQYKDVQVKL